MTQMQWPAGGTSGSKGGFSVFFLKEVFLHLRPVAFPSTPSWGHHGD